MLRKSLGLAVAAIFVAGAAVAAPRDDKKKKLTEVTVCPISGKEAPTADNAKVYGKYNVHFCCANCPAAWDKLSKKEKDAKIKAAMKPAPKKKAEATGTKLIVVSTCPMTGEAVKGEGGGKSVIGKYEVHFCCAGCKAPFDKMTREEQEAKIKTALK